MQQIAVQTTPRGTIGEGDAEFEILRTINYGGFGVVKLVRSLEGEVYAMKVFELEKNKAYMIAKIQEEFEMI